MALREHIYQEQEAQEVWLMARRPHVERVIFCYNVRLLDGLIIFLGQPQHTRIFAIVGLINYIFLWSLLNPTGVLCYQAGRESGDWAENDPCEKNMNQQGFRNGKNPGEFICIDVQTFHLTAVSETKYCFIDKLTTSTMKLF